MSSEEILKFMKTFMDLDQLTNERIDIQDKRSDLIMKRLQKLRSAVEDLAEVMKLQDEQIKELQKKIGS